MLFGAGIAVYDEIVAVPFPWSGDPFTRLDAAPFAPMLAWPTDKASAWLDLGLGDLLVAILFAPVRRKAY